MTRATWGPCPSAPGHVEHGAGDVAGIVAEQPDDGVGHLLGAAGALHRHQRRHLARPVGLAARGMDVGLDDAGAHRVDAHAFGGHLLGQADGEGVDGALGCGVVHVLARRRRGAPPRWRR